MLLKLSIHILSMVFYLLNLLAFIAHVLSERGDRLYQRCRATTSQRELWNTRCTAMRMSPVTQWVQCLLMSLDEAGPSPEGTPVQAGTLHEKYFMIYRLSRERLEASQRRAGQGIRHVPMS